MTNQHTPGPWLPGTDGFNKTVGVVYAKDGYKGAPQDIACVYRWFREGPANAQLIAAAPELLAALQGALKALDAISVEMTVGDRFTNAGQYLIDSLEPARAAIAKATGSGT